MARSKLGLALAALRWNEDEARCVVEAWRASGQSIPRFAAACGIGGERLRRWVRFFEAGRRGAGPEPAFVEVSAAATIGRAVWPSSPPLVLTCGGDLRIEVPVGFDAETLVAVLAALESQGQRC